MEDTGSGQTQGLVLLLLSRFRGADPQLGRPRSRRSRALPRRHRYPAASCQAGLRVPEDISNLLIEAPGLRFVDDTVPSDPDHLSRKVESSRVTLLCLSSGGVLDVEGVESPVELTREVALEAPSDLSVREAFGSSLVDYARVSTSWTIRVTVAMCKARLSLRSPPRLRRWRLVLPDEAGIGLTPARLDNAASSRTQPGCDQAA